MMGLRQHTLLSLLGITGLAVHGADDSIDQISCDEAQILRTGDWVNKQCTIDEVVMLYSFTPSERWKALECQYCWEDAIRVWRACNSSKYDGYDFATSIADFLHVPLKSECNYASIETDCGLGQGCEAHSMEQDKDKTGACTYEIWNSLLALREMIITYYNALTTATDELKWDHETFIDTFAPKVLDEGTKLFTLFQTLLPIPFNTAAARFFGGAFMFKYYFSGNTTGKVSEWEAATSNIISTGSSVAKDALKKASDDHADFPLDTIYDKLTESWKSQAKALAKKLFGGDKDSIKALTDMLLDGKMIGGKPERGSWENSEHMDNWDSEKNIQRAFYAAAIPAVWGAKHLSPVVVDFGASCEIDARKYFKEEPDAYNLGWRCPDGHSYILAGVRDGPQLQCAPSYPGDNGGCNHVLKWTLDRLGGIGEIQDPGNDWGVTVDDLIIGAVNTWEKNGKKNNMNPAHGMPDDSDRTVAEEYKGERLDIRRAGLIRIPVCSVEEATANLNKGRELYGDSPNYPCNP